MINRLFTILLIILILCTKVLAANNELSELNQSFYEAMFEQDNKIISQTLNKVDIFIKNNPNNYEAYLLKASILNYLNETEEEYEVIIKANKIKSVGESQLYECLLMRQLNISAESIQPCYEKTIDLFESSFQSPSENINYVFANLLANTSDSKKILQNYIDKESDERQLETLRLLLDEYFGDQFSDQLPLTEDP